MTQSAEYPDLKWMPPKSWTNANRTSVQVVIIHDTEGSENATSAEDGASYDQRRTDGTSTHYFHDQNSTVQCVLTADQAHAARTQGNRRGIQHELCGRASQGAAGWADAASAGTLRQAAKQVARDCKKWNIPVRKLTASQVAAGSKGICGHADITAAFPADNGTHTDPGPTFPWATFIDMVQSEPTGDDIVTTQAEFNDFMDGWWNARMSPNAAVNNARTYLRVAPWHQGTGSGGAGPTAFEVLFGEMRTSLAGLSGDQVNEAEIVSGLLAVLTPEAIAAAIPADIAEGVAASLAARLAA